MDAQSWSAVVGLLCLVISYLVVRPLKQAIDNIVLTMQEIKNTLECIRTDAGNMRNDISVLQQQVKASFRCIDELRDDLRKAHDLINELRGGK